MTNLEKEVRELERVALFWHNVGGHNGEIDTCTLWMCKSAIHIIQVMKDREKLSLPPTELDSELEEAILQFRQSLRGNQESLGKDFEEVLDKNFWDLMVKDTKKVTDLMKQIVIIDKRKESIYAHKIQPGDVCIIKKGEECKAYMRIVLPDATSYDDDISFVDLGTGQVVFFTIDDKQPVTPVQVRIELIINENEGRKEE